MEHLELEMGVCRLVFDTKITFQPATHILYIKVVPKKNVISTGANERVLPTDFRSVFIFFLSLMVDFSFSIKVFKNHRGDPWMKTGASLLA